jgi:hypothetical protein
MTRSLRVMLLRERARIISIGAPPIAAPDERPPLPRGPGGNQG